MRLSEIKAGSSTIPEPDIPAGMIFQPALTGFYRFVRDKKIILRSRKNGSQTYMLSD